MLTALRIVPSSKRGANGLRDFDSDTFLRFRSRGAEMRSENEIRHFAQWRIGRQRLRFENIESGGGDMTAAQSLARAHFRRSIRRARN